MESVNLERFSGFIKPKEVASQLQKPEKRRIIGYTRVSTKRQIEGYSIEEQTRNIRDFAKTHNYELIDIIDGEYESAKSDFTRKEFKRLYETAIKMKPKPYAIAIKFISRFSRSGGKAISLVDDLVYNKCIHLLETSTGLCTDNEKGRIQIYEKLLEAEKENIQRLERTLPGMKSLLEAGNWLGKAPLGYDTYGKRVIDDNKLRGKQKIVLNEQGEHLREAWKWKVLGWSDAQIKKELWDRYQMKVTICRLGYIWSNPFYAGVCVNKLLDKPVKGNWEAIVSEADFFKINYKDDPLAVRKYNTEGNIEYPLAHFAYCSHCSHIMVGYTNKKKGISYYKCKTCNKNYNADTLTHSRNKGINDVFAEMLSQYSLDERLKAALLEAVVEKMCGGNHIKEYLDNLESQIKAIKAKEEALDDKYLYHGFPQEKYEAEAAKLSAERMRLEVNRDEVIEKSSNSLEDAKNAVETICKVHTYWMLGDLELKKKLQDVVFPKGILINPDNREVLTPEINPFFIKKPCNSDGCEEGEQKNKADFQPYSQAVAGMRIELMTSGL